MSFFNEKNCAYVQKETVGTGIKNKVKKKKKQSKRESKTEVSSIG